MGLTIAVALLKLLDLKVCPQDSFAGSNRKGQHNLSLKLKSLNKKRTLGIRKKGNLLLHGRTVKLAPNKML